MRIRSIHPEFYRSEDVAALNWDARLVFIGLWSYVDDNGVGRDNERLIVAELFPLEEDPRDTLATVSDALAALSDGGQITRYTVDGKHYLHVNAWKKWQKIDKPGKERYPLPTREDAVIRDIVATPSRDVRETPVPGEGEKGRRGEGSSSEIADAIPDDKNDRDDINRVCTHLADRIEENGSKRPPITKAWRDAARLLIDRDGRGEDQIHRCIDWCQDDTFWRTNILSMPKLREKYDQLRLKATERPMRAVPAQQDEPDPYAWMQPGYFKEGA